MPSDQRPAQRTPVEQVILLAALWALLVEGSAKAPLFGLASVLAAAWLARAIRSRASRRLRLVGLARFVPYYLKSSILGGIDVAQRALSPRPDLDPGFLRMRSRLPRDHGASAFYVGVVSLLPGTLCARVQGEELELHVIDQRLPNIPRLRELESRVADVFGLAVGSEP
jgi:multicomponent Na+:H+ antiporter subunit E